MIWFILFTLLIFLSAGAVYWGVVLWPWIKHRNIAQPLGYWRHMLVALPLVFITFALLRADASQLFSVLSPPIGLMLYLKQLNYFIDFAWPLVFSSATVFILTVAILFKFLPKIQSWHASIATITSIAAFLTVGEIRTNMLQMTSIAKMKFDCVKFRSFTKSISLAGEEFQFDYHTSGQIGKDVYGWSYKTLNFYKVPDGVIHNLPLPCAQN